MDLPTFQELLTPTGQAALADAAALRPTEAGFLSAFESLRKKYPPPLAKAALETVLLRARARGKNPLWDRSYYTRESLEQASGEAVSRYRAERFRPFATALDLCCGVGTDATRLALAGCFVEAVDSDPLRLAMAAANAAAFEVSDRIQFHPGDVLTLPLPPADAAFVDPSRREGERRVLDPNRYLPPLGAVRNRFPSGFPLAAKIAPGVAWADIERLDAEVEFISLDGELRECVLWFGPLRSSSRRATVLTTATTHTLAADGPPPYPSTPGEVQEFVFDPDASTIRAGLLPVVADQLGAAPVDHGVAFLTGAEDKASPFVEAYRVELAVPFHVGKLREFFREHRIGRLTVLKRAVDLDVNEVTRKLKLEGADHRHLILTRSLGKTVAIIAEKVKRQE